jgi:hypothetical protein
MTNYFSRSWPTLASRASLTWLGLAEMGVGFCLLGNLNEDFASKESMGTAFNTLLIASGVCVSLTGLFSFIAVRLPPLPSISQLTPSTVLRLSD